MNKIKKGFTLIELLIVVAIIGILATVVILNVANARQKAQTAKAKEDTNQVLKAVMACTADGGTIIATKADDGYADFTAAKGHAICENSEANVTSNYPAGTPSDKWEYELKLDDDPAGRIDAATNVATVDGKLEKITCMTGGCTYSTEELPE